MKHIREKLNEEVKKATDTLVGQLNAMTIIIDFLTKELANIKNHRAETLKGLPEAEHKRLINYPYKE